MSPYIDKEIILIDDCSIDGTRDLIKNSVYKQVSKVIYHDKNLGKGAAAQAIQNANLMCGLDEAAGLNFDGLGV